MLSQLLRRSGPRRHHGGRTRARFQLEGLEDRSLLSGISALTDFSDATSSATGLGDWGITRGPDGNLWFTQYGSSEIGMINPTTDAIAEFPTRTAGAGPRGITTGPDGNIWFAEWGANKIGVINATTHVVSEFTVPSAGSEPQDITTGPDGKIWFTEYGANKVGVINPTTHAVSEFTVPTKNSIPYGITTGPDGNVWFTERSANKIGLINPTTHAITEFAVPGSDLSEVASGPNGNLWFGAAGDIGEFNPNTHVATTFAFPTPSSGVSGITTGPDGNVWCTEGANALHPQNIDRINPVTGFIIQYPVTSTSSVVDPHGLTVGPDGNLWFGEFRGGVHVGFATLTAPELTVTQQPPANVVAGSPFSLTVQAPDSSYNSPVTVGLAYDPPGFYHDTLGGTLTVNATNGVATFSDLVLTRVDKSYSLFVSGGGYGWSVTNPSNVTAAAATQLVITQQPPATVSAKAPFGLVAVIEDQYGNVVTSASDLVTVALAADPGGAVLGGTTTVVAVNGVVTFSNLTLNKKGKGYTLQLSGAGLAGTTSGPITVK